MARAAGKGSPPGFPAASNPWRGLEEVITAEAAARPLEEPAWHVRPRARAAGAAVIEVLVRSRFREWKERWSDDQ